MKKGRPRRGRPPAVATRILRLLSDGMPHSIEEVHRCLDETDSPLGHVYSNIHNLRKILRKKGEDIICENVRRKTHYRHVRLLSPAGE